MDDATQPADASKKSVGVVSLVTQPVERASELIPLQRLDQHAIAHRLSLLLWSSPPDEQLRKLADAETLLPTSSDKFGGIDAPSGKPETELARQVDRMIADPRFQQGFIEHFVGQWLDLRRINATTPTSSFIQNSTRYLSARWCLRRVPLSTSSSKRITQCGTLLTHRSCDRSYPGKHYEMEEAFENTVSNELPGEVFRPVPLPESHVRGGVLTQAAILKVTANGTVSSPVLRGAWVMKRLLGQPLLHHHTQCWLG